MQPIDDARTFLQQARALAGEITQDPLLRRRHETGAQQPMLQQIGDPFGISYVGLASRHRFEVLGINHQQFEVPFQQIVDGFPEHPGTLHGHMGHAQRFEPIAHAQHPARHGAKRAALLLEASSRIKGLRTAHHRPFVNVKTCTALVDNMHLSPP